MIINKGNIAIEPTDVCINCTLEGHCPTVSFLKDIVTKHYSEKHCGITINNCEELIRKEE